MNIFIVNLVLLFIWSVVIRPELNQQRTRIFVFIISFQLFLIALFSPIVSDALMYENWARNDIYPNTNIGWVLVSRLAWSIWPSAKALLCTVSIISLTSIGHFFLGYSKNLPLSYLMYICLGIWGLSFFVFRQSLAFAICLFSFGSIERRDLRRFLIIVLIACLFHETAAAFLIAYPLATSNRLNRFRALIMAGISILFLLFYRPFFTLLFSLFRNGDIYEISSEVVGVGHLAILVFFTVFAYILGKSDRESTFQKTIDAGLVVQLGCLHFPEFVRLVYFFDFAAMISVPNAICCLRDRKQRLFAELVLITFLLAVYIFSANFGFPGGPQAYIPTLPI